MVKSSSYCRLPSSSVSKESSCNTGDLGLIPGSRTSPGEGNGNPLQYSCLENPMNRGAWQVTVHGVTRVRRNLATKPPPHHLIVFESEIANKYISYSHNIGTIIMRIIMNHITLCLLYKPYWTNLYHS